MHISLKWPFQTNARKLKKEYWWPFAKENCEDVHAQQRDGEAVTQQNSRTNGDNEQTLSEAFNPPNSKKAKAGAAGSVSSGVTWPKKLATLQLAST